MILEPAWQECRVSGPAPDLQLNPHSSRIPKDSLTEKFGKHGLNDFQFPSYPEILWKKTFVKKDFLWKNVILGGTRSHWLQNLLTALGALLLDQATEPKHPPAWAPDTSFLWLGSQGLCDHPDFSLLGPVARPHQRSVFLRNNTSLIHLFWLPTETSFYFVDCAYFALVLPTSYFSSGIH